MLLTDEEIANSIYNESRSFSGVDLEMAWLHMAHIIMNGDEIEDRFGIRRVSYARTANYRSKKIADENEQRIYYDIMQAVQMARFQRVQVIDPTGGALNFRFVIDKDLYTDFLHFKGRNGKMKVAFKIPYVYQIGPFNNSFPFGDVPARTGIFLNVYYNERIKKTIDRLAEKMQV